MSGHGFPKWDPGDVEAFRAKIIEKRANGKTWTKIAAEEGISKVTFYKWCREEQPEFLASVKKDEKQEIRDNLKSTLIEVAIKDRNVTALIYLNKALNKMWDQPKQQPQPKPPEENEPKHTAMTPEQAREELKKRQEGLKLVQENS